MSLPMAEYPRHHIPFRQVDPTDLGAGGQVQGLNMGTPFQQLFMGSLEEEAYARMFQEALSQALAGLQADIGLSGGSAPLSAYGPAAATAGGLGQSGVQQSGIPDTLGLFRTGLDQNAYLNALIEEQQPSGWDQAIAALLPIIGTGAGAAAGGLGIPGLFSGGGMAGASLGGTLGGGAAGGLDQFLYGG